MGLAVPYTGTRGERGEKKIFVSQTSTNDPCNLCTYLCEIQWETLKKKS